MWQTVQGGAQDDCMNRWRQVGYAKVLLQGYPACLTAPQPASVLPAAPLCPPAAEPNRAVPAAAPHAAAAVPAACSLALPPQRWPPGYYYPGAPRTSRRRRGKNYWRRGDGTYITREEAHAVTRRRRGSQAVHLMNAVIFLTAKMVLFSTLCSLVCQGSLPSLLTKIIIHSS